MIQRKKSGGDGAGIAQAVDEEVGIQIENSLRPHVLSEYIGQDKIKKNLNLAMEAARGRGEPLEHILLHGPAGLGKTTLGNLIAREMGAAIRVTSGPALEKQGDLAALLTNLEKGDVLFIDEIHRLRAPVQEVLYTAMEDFGIDMILGKGPGARSVRLNIPPFTLIGATTKMSLLTAPLRDRFGTIFKFDFYTNEDIKKILLRSSKILHCAIEDGAADLLSVSCRQTPRVANRLLRRARDFAHVHGEANCITSHTIGETLKMLGVDALGLDEMDRTILKTIIRSFKGGPVGLNTLSSAFPEEEATIEDIYEPYLLQIGFLERTPRGRKTTHRAYRHLGMENPQLI